MSSLRGVRQGSGLPNRRLRQFLSLWRPWWIPWNWDSPAASPGPGGNLTGLSSMAPRLVGKQLEFLKQSVPTVSRVAVLWNPANPANPPQLRAAEASAVALGIELQ